LPIIIKNDFRKIGLISLNKQKIKDLKDFKDYLKSYSTLEFNHFMLEKQNFPEFNFTDIDGNKYTNSSLKSKKIILKCWFINCTACVAEFPEVNKLIDKYSTRNDFEYLSLAFEENEALRNFLLKKPLKYKVIGNKRSFIEDTLKLNLLPTHYIIDENGKIVKVLNNVNALKTSLKDIIGY
jgi:peroxiredoxin